MDRKPLQKRSTGIFSLLCILLLGFGMILSPVSSSIVPAGCIDPEDLVYRGAFRVPADGTEEYGWAYGGGGLTYFPGGDGSGAEDGYPGSLFGMGHDQRNLVTEISIPAPVESPEKQLDALNRAEMLQPFSDLYAGLFVDSGQGAPFKGDLCYLPPQGVQTSAKLYFSFAEHMQYDRVVSHAWSELDLSNPEVEGAWLIGSYPNFCTNDYLFEIPAGWASGLLPGYRLATGRFRDGSLGGSGPALFAIAPWLDGDPPNPGSSLAHVVPLLLYEKGYEGSPNVMKDYTNADEWSGGAWITSGNRAAVVFAGTRGRGTCWYGFSDGTVWPDEPPYPPIPPPPDDDRGWWAERFEGVLLFFNPDDLAAVASGQMEPWQPQPYAELEIDPLLFHVTGDQQKRHLGAAAFDRGNGYLYITEFMADGDACLIHVWQVIPLATPRSITGVFRPSSYQNWILDYDRDGDIDLRDHYGSATDIPLMGDINSDGNPDRVVYRAGEWIFDHTMDGSVDVRDRYGVAGDLPLVGDFNGDDFNDRAVFRTGQWIIDLGRDGSVDVRDNYGTTGDIPLIGDFNNDGIADRAVFRASAWDNWILDYGMDGTVNSRNRYGQVGDIPVIGDFNRDRHTDRAVFRAGEWIIDDNMDGSVNSRLRFGTGGDLPLVWNA